MGYSRFAPDGARTHVDLTDLPDDPPRILKLRPEMRLVRRVLYVGTFVMLAMVTQFFVNAADQFMVGRLDPAEATASQAALGLGMPLYWAVGGFFSALSYGTQALTGRRFGEKDEHRAGGVLFNSLIVAVVAGAIGTFVGYYYTPAAVDFLAEASDEQRRLGTAYAQVRCLAVAGMVVTFSYKAFFDGIGQTHVHLIAAITMNVFNIGLNYLLIFGSPDLGIPQDGSRGCRHGLDAQHLPGPGDHVRREPCAKSTASVSSSTDRGTSIPRSSPASSS